MTFLLVFGEPEFQTGNRVKSLAFNLPYMLVPMMMMLFRMRKPAPSTRRF